MFPHSQTKVHAGLELKSLSGFFRPSSQTHTGSIRGVSNLKYLLWAYEGQAAPGCCAEGLGSADIPVCFRRRYSSSRASSWELHLHTRDLGWVQLWWPPPPKTPSAFCPCQLCGQQRAQRPCSAGITAASRGSAGAGWCMNHNANMMTQELWDLPLVFSVIFWGSTLAQLITLYNRFLLVICRSNFQDCPSVPN